MKDFIKLFTSVFFQREKFAEVLVEDCGIPCAVQPDGLVFDRSLLIERNADDVLPAWVYTMWGDIFSMWHTRKAQRGEWPKPPRYSVISCAGVNERTIGKAHTFNRAKAIADKCASVSENTSETFYVLDEKEDRDEVYMVFADSTIENFVQSIPDWTRTA